MGSKRPNHFPWGSDLTKESVSAATRTATTVAQLNLNRPGGFGAGPAHSVLGTETDDTRLQRAGAKALSED